MCRLVAVACMLAAAACAAGQAGAVSLTLTTRPSPLGLGQNLFGVSVEDAAGQPVDNADVSLLMVMPADPKTKHPEMRTEGKLNHIGGGRYSGIAVVTMAGDWDVTVAASRRGRVLGRSTQRLTAHATTPRGKP